MSKNTTVKTTYADNVPAIKKLSQNFNTNQVKGVSYAEGIKNYLTPTAQNNSAASVTSQQNKSSATAGWNTTPITYTEAFGLKDDGISATPSITYNEGLSLMKSTPSTPTSTNVASNGLYTQALGLKADTGNSMPKGVSYTGDNGIINYTKTGEVKMPTVATPDIIQSISKKNLQGIDIGSTGTTPTTSEQQYQQQITDLQKQLAEQKTLYQELQNQLKELQNSGSASNGTMTYEEYIAQMKDNAQSQLDASNKAAEATRQRAIVDAQSSYEQNKATYGANAEALADMGLTGSGYSDYINSQAYAQQRADVQAANTQEAASKQQAQMTYADYIAELNKSAIEHQESVDAENQSKYASLLQNAASGTYTADEITAYAKELGMSDEQIANLSSTAQRAYDEQAKTKNDANYQSLLENINNGVSWSVIKNMAERQGLSEEEIATLQSAAETYEAEKKQSEADAAYPTILENAMNGSYTADDIETLADYYGLSDTQKQNLLNEVSRYTANAQKDAYNTYKYNLDSGIFDTIEVDAAYRNGSISAEQYDSLKTDYNTAFVQSLKNAGGFSAFSTYEEAKQNYNEAMADSWLSDETKAQVTKLWEKAVANTFRQSAVDDTNKDETTNALFNKVANSSGYQYYSPSGYQPPSERDYWYLEIGGAKYKLIYGFKITDFNLVGNLNELATGSWDTYPTVNKKSMVVLYNGKLYACMDLGTGAYWHILGGDDVDRAIEAYRELD